MRRVALIAAAIAIVDQITKFLAVRLIHETESIPVIPGFFNLVHVRNTGAAWGMFKDNNLLLAVVCALTILGLYLFRHSFQLHRTVSCIALGLILGGIVGNFIDRVRVHSVIDFLDFYLGRQHWPAFNVADSAICIGVVLYIFVSWRSDKRTQGSQPAS